ncbi:hypothetical protein niasHS_002245 [Heterodera schachtii]|uniref:3'-5' exonuclease domain-containing protein n=1 Tax=Heterodera schachtii TaxID=97005 RepID=A0ABD2KMX6_HETSC
MVELDGAPMISAEEILDTKISFQDCVRKIKKTHEEINRAFDMEKFDIIQRTMRMYFESEDSADVFEGFLNVVKYVKSLTTEQLDISLVKLALLAFYEFQKLGIAQGQQIPFDLHIDKTLLLDALVPCFRLKTKYIEPISSVFHLKDREMVEVAIAQIKTLLENEVAKAVFWMDHLNLRDHFPFNTIVCKLILENQTALIYPFVGESQFRRNKLIHYLDNLLGLVLRNRRAEDEYEREIMKNQKQLEKLTRKFVKNFELTESEVPNLMKLGTQNALLYNHYRWCHKEITWSQFEEIARHALQFSSDVRDHYFRRLFESKLPERACHFAELLELSEHDYIPELRHYCQQNADEVQRIRNQIRKDIAIRLQNQQIEEQCVCELTPGHQIVLVDTWPKLEQLIDHLRHDNEELFGIDAEWRPHYLCAAEKISLIQIATTKAVFLVDVLVLEESRTMTESQWLNFFDALLCTDVTRKIGYDFRNDMRVLRSTFPFIAKLFPTVKKVVCMYRLLSKVDQYPEASRIVFDRTDVAKPTLSLSGVSEYFLNIKLEKTEREGNWSQRPLRLEQKKYAAQDAHCLNRIFRIVASKLKRLKDNELAKELKRHSLIDFNEEKAKPTMAIPLLSGQLVRVKEGEEDFILNVQKAAGQIERSANGALDGFRTIGDVRFIVDSMLFGLGKRLRKCGFDTRMIGDREQIVEFCKQSKDEKFVVLSAGKGHKQLALQMPDNEVVNVPIATDGTTPPSLLVSNLLDELGIILRPSDMWSRCVECNKRSFVRIPKRIVQTLCFMTAVRHSAEWMGVDEQDLNESVARLKAESVPFDLDQDNDYEAQQRMLDAEEYILIVDQKREVCLCRNFSIDMLNRLLLADHCWSPVQMRVGLKYKKDTFDVAGIQFYVCSDCGRLQLNSASSE